MAKIKLICEQCGVEFYRYQSNVRPGTSHHFCSIDCKRDYSKSKKEKRICEQCGKEFFVYKSAIEKSNVSGKFCCRKCYNQHQKTLTGNKNNHYTKIDGKCDYCGKNIKVIPSRRAIYKFSFCDLNCKNKFMSEYLSGENNPNWKGGSSRYRGDFEKVKKDYFSGTQICAICGTIKNIHIHHIIPYRLSHDNSLSNLIPLCNRHHKIIESVSLKFIELFDDDDYDVAKKYLNLMLREKQYETQYALKKLQEAQNESED